MSEFRFEPGFIYYSRERPYKRFLIIHDCPGIAGHRTCTYVWVDLPNGYHDLAARWNYSPLTAGNHWIKEE